MPPAPPTSPRGYRLSVYVRSSVALVVALAFTVAAEAQLRVVTYNIAQLRGDDSPGGALEDVIAWAMEDDKPGFATPVSVFIFQEVRNADLPVLADIIAAATPPGVLYAQGTYTNFNEDGVGGAQAMFYRAGMLLEDQSAHKDIFTGAGRYTDRWLLRLLGYDSPDASFYIYSSHLKASPGGSNEQQRLVGVQAIRADADALGPGVHIIYGGDFNFYHNLESGYLYFLTSGAGQANDPLGTGNWTGPGQAIKHSQSPRLIHEGGLVGGGMNQRFDFQLHTSPFSTGHGLSYIAGTYRSFGNDGLHFNDAINAGDNFYYPDDVIRSNALADALHDASDHIPVIVDYQVPARMAANINPANFGKVIQQGDFAISFAVQNTAPFVVTPLGADLLEYTAIGDGVVAGETSGAVEATMPPSTGSLPLDTSAVGTASGSITFISENEAVQNPVIVRNVSGTIVAPSAPSFAGDTLMSEAMIEIDLDGDTGAHFIEVDVYNFSFDTAGGLQALLNVDGVDGAQEPFAYLTGPVPDIGEEPATLVFAFDTESLPDGTYVADVTIHTSDEDLPGAGASQLELALIVNVGEVSDCPADLNGDGVVDVSDLLILLGQWGVCPRSGECVGDLNGDGVVDVSDLLLLLGAWGGCP